MNRPDRDPAPAAPTLPAADLFLGLAGVLLVAVALVASDLGALIGQARAVATAPDAAPPAAAAAALAAGRGATVLLAGPAGVDGFGPAGPLGSMAQDDLPGAVLPAGWLAPGAVPLVLVAADAGDTAFLLEAALARGGVARMERLRLPPDCAALHIGPRGLSCAAPP